VGCRGRATKADLVRIVRGPAGEAEVDRTGSAPGRGAYVHRRLECVDAAFVRGSLARALRTSVSKERAATLRADIEEEPKA
jgi:uncharacterized protein